MTTSSSADARKLEGAALIDSLRKKIGSAAIAGALVPLAVAGMASTAVAGIPPFERSSRVDSTVTAPGEPGNFSDDLFLYEFTLFNTSTEVETGGTRNAFIVDWELPLFSLNGIDIDNIASPEGWTFEIIDIEGNIVINEVGDDDGFSSVYANGEGPYGFYDWDYDPATDPALIADSDVYGGTEDQFRPENFGNKLILHWFDDPDDGNHSLGPPFDGVSSLDGFSFLAADGSTNVPYLASWDQEDPTAGDPPTPGSAGLGTPNNASVPEPAAIGLFATGLLGLLGIRRRRKKA